MLPTPNAESVPFVLVRPPVKSESARDAAPESARVVAARPPPRRANVSMEDLPSIIVEPPPEALLAPIAVPLVAPSLEPYVAPPSPIVASAPEPARLPAPAPASAAPRAVAVALLGIVMGIAVGGSAVAWRTHGASLPSFVTVAR